MSTLLANHPPRRLLDWLKAERPRSTAIPLVTIDEAGFPHIALLSWFEVIAVGDKLFFFLRDGSSSAANLSKRPGTLLFVTPAFVFYLKGRADRQLSHLGQDLFRFELQQVLEDRPRVEETGTEVTSGIAFSDPEPVRRERLRLRGEMVAKCRMKGDE